jgi:hypothetical protein
VLQCGHNIASIEHNGWLIGLVIMVVVVVVVVPAAMLVVVVGLVMTKLTGA